MFSQACAKNSVHRRGGRDLSQCMLGAGTYTLWPDTRGEGCLPQCMLEYTPPTMGRHPPGRHALRADIPLGRHPPGRHPQADHSWSDTPAPGSHCSGRYASYWNAFLLYLCVCPHYHDSLAAAYPMAKRSLISYGCEWQLSVNAVCLPVGYLFIAGTLF